MSDGEFDNLIVNVKVGIGTKTPAGKMEVKTEWGDWLFLRQKRDFDGDGGFHIHNPWGDSTQLQGDPRRNRLEFGYRSPTERIYGGSL